MAILAMPGHKQECLCYAAGRPCHVPVLTLRTEQQPRRAVHPPEQAGTFHALILGPISFLPQVVSIKVPAPESCMAKRNVMQ